MAAGVPILGMMDPGSEIGRTITETGCGVVFGDPDGAQIAEFIRGIRADPAQRRDMGARGRTEFLSHYTLDAAAERYENTMERAFGLTSP
jgi:glycosyltransferase involved in cell wall biosynthesis